MGFGVGGGNNIHLPDFFDSSFIGIDLGLIALLLHGPRLWYVVASFFTVGMLRLFSVVASFSLRLCYVVASFSCRECIYGACLCMFKIVELLELGMFCNLSV